jgi:hypothetical protein
MLLALALAAVAAPARATEVAAAVHASKTDVTVGERFTVEVVVDAPPGTTFTFPAELSEETIELRARVEARPQLGRQAYDASVFALSDVKVPPIKVSYRLPDGTTGETETPAVELEVSSILPKDPKEQQLADIRPPVSLSIGRAFWITAGTLTLLLAGLAVWLWRRQRPAPAAAPAAPPVPPDVAANAALDGLAASGLLLRDEYRSFYIQLTEIAKRYLERRLAAPILEMTTAEMVAFLRDDSRAGALVELMRDLSGAADQIKFARGEGARERAEQHLAAVRRMVAALEAQLRPAVSASAAAGAPARAAR